MLELLGFIALIAIIFGVSMTAAVGIIVKAVLWIIGVCAAFAIVGKMQASTAKTLAWIAVIAGGILLAGLDAFQNTTYAPCFSLNTDILGWEVYADCMSGAARTVEARTSTAIWLIVIGIVLFIAAWVKGGSSNNVTSNVSAKTDNAEEERKVREQKEMRAKAAAMGMTVVSESQHLKEQIAEITKRLPSLRKRMVIGIWITCITFVLGPVLFLALMYFLPNEVFSFFDEYPVVYDIAKGVSITSVLVFPFFLALTPYWAVFYKRAKRELEELKDTLKKSKKA